MTGLEVETSTRISVANTAVASIRAKAAPMRVRGGHFLFFRLLDSRRPHWLAGVAGFELLSSKEAGADSAWLHQWRKRRRPQRESAANLQLL